MVAIDAADTVAVRRSMQRQTLNDLFAKMPA